MKNPFQKPALVWTLISAVVTFVFAVIYTSADSSGENVLAYIFASSAIGFALGGGIPAVALWSRARKWAIRENSREEVSGSNYITTNWVDNEFYSINISENLIDVEGVIYNLSEIDKSSITIDDQHDRHKGKAVSMNITVSFMVGTDYVSIIFLKKPKYLTSDDYRDAMAKAKKLVAILSK